MGRGGGREVQEVERAGVRGRAGRSTGEGAQERRREGGQGGAWLHIHQLAHPRSIIYNIYLYRSIWYRDTLQAAVAEGGRGRGGGGRA